MALTVRERAPLRHDFEIETPSGRKARWAADEPKPENVPNGWRKSSTMPGGWESCDLTLARHPARDFQDLEELSKLTIRQPGDEIVGEYRLQASPRTSGDQLAISPSAVGYQAHLDDDKTAQFIYADRDMTRWQGMSVQRKLNLATAAVYAATDADGATPDATTGAPSIHEQISGAWTAPLPMVEAWYDAGSALSIGELRYLWKTAITTPATNNFHWEAFLSSDDIASVLDSSGDLASNAASGSGTLTSSAGRRFALLQFWNSVAGGADGSVYDFFWPLAAVYGDHNLTLHDNPDDVAPGLLSSDVEAHAVARFAPKLGFTTGPDGTIEPSAFLIPHLAFPDPTTASEIVKQATRFELRDWAVWEGPTYYSNARGARGRHWRARTGPAQLQETGPSIDRLWNYLMVQYQDETGVRRTVGWPGSGADVEDASLFDPDPENPATRDGTPRRALLVMQTSTAAGALNVGRRFLEEQKAISSAGSARLVGHVEDDKGVLWPASRVRAGDSIVFVDAADPGSARRIVRADYTDSDKSCAVDLDAPAEALQALLERLSVVLVPLGVS